jgi:hypothetical protein
VENNEDPMDGYKLLLVPMRDIRLLSRSIPQVAVVPGGASFEVVADVGADRRLRMSRQLYDTIEVVDPPGGSFTEAHFDPGLMGERGLGG